VCVSYGLAAIIKRRKEQKEKNRKSFTFFSRALPSLCACLLIAIRIVTYFMGKYYAISFLLLLAIVRFLPLLV
jgi:Ca2+/Na+ antiporter